MRDPSTSGNDVPFAVRNYFATLTDVRTAITDRAIGRCRLDALLADGMFAVGG